MINLIFSVLSFIKLSFIYIKRAANGNCVLTFQMFLLAKNVPYAKVINISMSSVVEHEYCVYKTFNLALSFCSLAIINKLCLHQFLVTCLLQ